MPPRTEARRRSPRLAITCGDPAGVGPELVAAWVRQHPATARRVTVLGPAAWLEALQRETGVAGRAVGPRRFVATAGRPSQAGARVALAAMEAAAVGCRRGEWEAVVTGPVSKEWCARVAPGFVGQTEFFAERWTGAPSMAFAGGRLRVVLVTWHVPLREVPAAASPEALARAVERAVWLAAAAGVEQPRIAVCGLNPHAGEAGLLGDEEGRVLDPVLGRLRRRWPGVSQCLPGDTAFARALRDEFDVVVAQYHDQGLAPLKAVDFERAANLTLGLPWVRTSPDHGTAFALAGTGRADGRSFASAVRWADRLSRFAAARPA
jgi:4-hydroxythreonine-4-phosphate dehydrogenase